MKGFYKDPCAGVQQGVLGNGLTVYALHCPDTPAQILNFIVHAGSKNDPPGLWGVAHFVEHLVSEGLGIPSTKIERFFLRHGGCANLGATSFLRTQYGFISPAWCLPKALDLYGNMLFRSKFGRPRIIKGEMEIVLGECREYFPSAMDYDLERRGNKNIFRGHWLENCPGILGCPDSLGRISQTDLLDFYSTYYVPANVTVVGVGELGLADLLAYLNKSPFSLPKKGERVALGDKEPMPLPPQETLYLQSMASHMPEMDWVSYRSIGLLPGSFCPRAIDVFEDMLCTLLYEEIRRRRGWTYDFTIGRSLVDTFWEFTIFFNSLSMEALPEIHNLVNRCTASVGFRLKLLKEIRERQIAQNTLLDMNSAQKCSRITNNIAMYGRVISVEEIIASLEEVTMRDIRAIAKCLVPERRWTLIKHP